MTTMWSSYDNREYFENKKKIRKRRGRRNHSIRNLMPLRMKLPSINIESLFVADILNICHWL